jgi:hypothetical protein
MRNAMGWAAAALIAAGCGGPGTGAQDAATDQPPGQPPEQPGTALEQPAPADATCAACAFEGTGQTLVGGESVSASASGSAVTAAAQPAGTAATGAIAFAAVEGIPAGPCGRGAIDTIWSCEILDGVGKVTLSGACDGGERFTAELSGPGLRLRDLDRCEPEAAPTPCPEGQCLCAATQHCEPCHEDGHEPPPIVAPPQEGTTPPPPDGGSTPPPPLVPL